jgi:uncharacterized protein YqgC (DUF456 family)
MDGVSLGRVLGLVGLYAGLGVGLLFIPLGLGGNFILLALALVVALVTHFQAVPWWALLVMGGLVAVGEILEAILGSVVAKRYGASRWGMLGAFVGGILGVIPGTAIAPIIGSIVGSFVGAAAGAILFESIHRRSMKESLPAGWGAVLGKLGATFLKVAIGLAIAAYLVVRTWP